MTFKTLIAPVALVAVSGFLSACSSVTESLETTDVFAPGAEVAVPAPIAGNAIDFTTLQQPPAIQQVVQAPAPVFAPPVVDNSQFVQQQFVEQPVFQQQQFEQQQFVEQPVFQQQEIVEAPGLPQVPVQQEIIEQVVEAPQEVITQYVQRPAAPAPVQIQEVTVTFDCSVIPSSKAALSEYRANCI